MNNRGMALILTLMVVAIITAMVVEFAYGVYVSTSALNNWQTSQRLSLLARSTTQLGAMLIKEKLRQPYTYPGVFETSQKAPVGEIESTITLRIEDENSKFNLNTLKISGTSSSDSDPHDDFVKLLDYLQINADIADRICYWIDSTTSHRPTDAKSETKNSQLDSLDELLLIPGIDRGSYEKLLPYVTIYGNNYININGAGMPVLLMIPKITRENAEKIVRQREIMPFDDKSNTLANLIGVHLSGTITKGTAFHISAVASSGNVTRVIDTIIYTGDGSSRKVLYWKEF
ncbi:MAG: type II secretion system minor pseudopilin GspK [Nitrospirae bacterium]|nr:type II secretion system minor pseudopilin GspK [Nitrospirota bacterium]